MLLSERIKLAMDQAGMSQVDLARACGVKPPSVHGWLSGKSKYLRGENLLQAARALNVREDWLATGAGPMRSLNDGDRAPITGSLRQESAGSFDENVSPAPIGMRPIPVISSVQAGALRDIDTPYPAGAGYAVEYTDQDLSRWAFALDVEGLSMAPQFQPGDRIIVDPELAPNPGDFVVARNGSEQATFKKYRPRGIDAKGEMIFELVPLNEDYPTLRSDTEHLIVIGVVTEHRKKLRRI